MFQLALLKTFQLVHDNFSYYWLFNIPGWHDMSQKFRLKFARQVGHRPRTASGSLNSRTKSRSWFLEQQTRRSSTPYSRIWNYSFTNHSLRQMRQKSYTVLWISNCDSIQRERFTIMLVWFYANFWYYTSCL